MPSLWELLQGVQQGMMRENFTQKGKGYFGPLNRPDGGISTELSFDFDWNGKNIHAPLMVPTLDMTELRTLLEGGQPTESMYRKAMDHAMDRILKGKPTFANPLEIYPLPK